MSADRHRARRVLDPALVPAARALADDGGVRRGQRRDAAHADQGGCSGTVRRSCFSSPSMLPLLSRGPWNLESTPKRRRRKVTARLQAPRASSALSPFFTAAAVAPRPPIGGRGPLPPLGTSLPIFAARMSPTRPDDRVRRPPWRRSRPGQPCRGESPSRPSRSDHRRGPAAGARSNSVGLAEFGRRVGRRARSRQRSVRVVGGVQPVRAAAWVRVAEAVGDQPGRAGPRRGTGARPRSSVPADADRAVLASAKQQRRRRLQRRAEPVKVKSAGTPPAPIRFVLCRRPFGGSVVRSNDCCAPTGC